MKKLILNKTNFAGAEPLTREQLKKVMGGFGSSYNPECLPDCEVSETDCSPGFACVAYEKEGCPSNYPPPKRCEPFV